ncbi:MAG: sodium-dependent transporter [Clostridia bacterium]|nr:sodium-dependent transporter [Clostridia bacterium]
MEREKFGSRLGFILISAGCAIGLGNVWRFPYITAEHGGAAFILVYLLFLVIFGLPIMTMEFAVGRASQKSIVDSFETLEPKGTKWHLFGWIGAAGNYLLMMFYTTVSGWMFIYFIKSIRGDFVGDSSQESIKVISDQFFSVSGNFWLQLGFMVFIVVLGFLICSLGLKNGVEKVTKVMMLGLLVLLLAVAIIVVVQPESKEGVIKYLVPDFSVFKTGNPGQMIFDAMGQAFFTLSLGMGSMAIFGSYIQKDRSLLGESVTIAGLDTFVALMAGLIIVPASTMFSEKVQAILPEGASAFEGPGLLFQVTPNIFNGIPGGRIWCTLFFLFMMFAALSTVVAVFENIVSFAVDKWGWSRKKSCFVNIFVVILLSVPCVLGFTYLSDFKVLGKDIQGIEDFIISNNILPLGSLVYVLFCTSKKFGWGWKPFIEEANTGNGIKFPKWLYGYCKFVIPVLILVLWAWGIWGVISPYIITK